VPDLALRPEFDHLLRPPPPEPPLWPQGDRVPASVVGISPESAPGPGPAPGPGRSGAQLAVLLAQGWLAVVVCLVAWAVAPVAIGWRPVLVTGGSMAPSIQPGDVVLIDRRAPVRPGMIVLAHGTRGDGQDVMHRVVAQNADQSVTTRGDANAGDDTSAVPGAQLGGVARLVVPSAGRIALALLALRHRLSGPAAGADGGPAVPWNRGDGLWLAVSAGAAVLAGPARRLRPRGQPPRPR